MFAASRNSDYQFVIEPELFDAESSNLLRSRLQLDDLSPRKTRITKITTPQAGDLLCLYRSGPVAVDAVDKVDAAGRQLLYAYGIVVKEPSENVIPKLIEKFPDAIDWQWPGLEQQLSRFLSSNSKWIPQPARSWKLPLGQPSSARDDRQKHLVPVLLVVIFAWLFSLTALAVVYSAKQALERDYADLKSRLQKIEGPSADSPANSTDKTPANSTDKPAEEELTKKGPLNIGNDRN